ncbi:MAG: HEAT repeat domain-containing protein [Kiritimatiellia bacterium]
MPLLSVLGELADPAVIPAVTAQTADTDEAVRLAAIAALGRLPANRDTLIALAGIAASPARLEARAAATSLARARGEGLDDLLLNGAKTGSTADRKAFITALGERQTPGAEPLLLGLRSDAEVGIRRASLQSLENLAGPDAHPAALAWMLAAPDPREALDAERLVILLGPKVPGALDALLAADASATDTVRAQLARCLARTGGDAALRRLRDYLARGNADLTAAVVRAFATWPDAAPVDDLLKLATAGGDARTAHLAMQSCLQLLGPDKSRTPAAKAALCATMLEKAARPDSRKLVLGSLARMSCPEAIALVTAHLKDPGCEDEAAAALRRLQYASLGPPVLSSSNNSGALPAATDGNPGSRWTTNTPMRPGQWLALDLHVPCTVRSVVLDTTGSDGDYPRSYEVWVGDTPEPAGPPALEGIGSAAVTEMIFDPPRTGRHVRIVQTGSDGGAYWSVHELKVDAEPVCDPISTATP